MISTMTGQGVSPWNPDPATIDPRDIAHALATQPRFNGQAVGHYSIAQHSLHVAAVSGDRWGLFHDAAEAYLGDMIRPLRPGLGWWRPGGEVAAPRWHEVEMAMLCAIAQRFGLPWSCDTPLPWPDSVREADDRVLAAEIRALFPCGFPGVKPDVAPAHVRIDPTRDWQTVEAEFLQAITAHLGPCA